MFTPRVSIQMSLGEFYKAGRAYSCSLIFVLLPARFAYLFDFRRSTIFCSAFAMLSPYLALHERGFTLIIFRFSSLVMLLHITFSSLLGPVKVCYCLLPGRQFLGVSSPLILSVLPLEELCSLVLFLQLLIFLLREWVLPTLNW